MAKFISAPQPQRVGKRNNGKPEYRAPVPIIFATDDGQIHVVPAGWRSDGVSWPGWMLLGVLALLAGAVGAYLLGAPVLVTSVLTAYVALLVTLWLAQPSAKLLIASFVHDWACQQTLLFPDKGKADRLFYSAMRALRVPLVYSWPMYRYVRLRSQRTQWQQPELRAIIDGNRIVGWE
jgi:hypothetical protein